MSKWNKENTEKLKNIAGDPTDIITADVVNRAVNELGFNTASISAKLRNLGYTVESLAKVRTKTFSDKEAEELEDFLVANSGSYTFAEISAAFHNGKFSPKEVQGKILSMELTNYVKPTPKVEKAKEYTDKQNAVVLKMLQGNAYIEDIAEAVDKSVQSVRGKVLSLLRQNPEIEMPKQRESHAKSNGKDALDNLENLENMTVDDIAEAIDKTARGVKSMLTHRGISCKNYNGSKKREKIDAAKGATS